MSKIVKFPTGAVIRNISVLVCMVMVIVQIASVPMLASADVSYKFNIGSSFTIDNNTEPATVYNDTYSYTSGSGGLDSLYSKSINCYKFDISSLGNQTVKDINLNLWINKANQSGTLSIKKITGGWIDSITNDNLTVNDISSLTVGSESVTRAFTAGSIAWVLVQIDISSLVQSSINEGKKTIQLYLTYTGGATGPTTAGGGLRIGAFNNTTYKPYLSITTEDPAPVFTSTSEYKYELNHYLHVEKDSTDDRAISVYKDSSLNGESSTYASVNSNVSTEQGNKRDLYYKFDLSQVPSNISTATLNMYIPKVNRYGYLYVYKLNSNWDENSDVLPSDVDAMTYDSSKFIKSDAILSTTIGYWLEIDIKDIISDFLKGNKIVKLYVSYQTAANDANNDGMRIDISENKPFVKVTDTAEVAKLSPNMKSISCSLLIQKGSEYSPQNAMPILALYDNNMKSLKKVVIGSISSLTGNAATLSLIMDLSDVQIDLNDNIKFYVWDGLINLNPVGNSGELSFSN